MQVTEERKLAVHLRYLRILTNKLLREDKYILPMYLLTVLFVTVAVSFFTILDQFPALQGGNGKFLLSATFCCAYLMISSPFRKIGLRHIASKLGLKSGSVPLAPKYERIAAHIRPALTKNGQNIGPSRYALTSIYIVLEIAGRAVSRLLQTLDKPLISSSLRGRLLRW